MSADTEVAFASIEEIARLYHKRKLSPLELTKLMLARIEKLNPKLNAYLTVTAELALAQAKKAEAELFAPRGRKRRDRGLLHGIPISLKDNIYTAGVRTTAGSKILKDFVPEHDAEVWIKLQKAGAILLGKTNLHEFAYGVTTNNPHFGPARNPWDPSRIPGGSSGGSAAAVAAGLCYGSIGTDTGGSIRIPAALCGVVGLKPGTGRVSVGGIVPLSKTLDFAGPIARTTRDAAILFESILVSHVKRDSALKSSRPKTRFSLGVPKEFFFDVVSDEIASSFSNALRAAEKKGAKIKEVSIPLVTETEHAGNQIALPEATHYHQQAGWFPARSADYSDDVRARLDMGLQISAMSYIQAFETQSKFFQQLLHAMVVDAGVDAMIVPTTPIAAPLIGEEKTIIGTNEYPTRSLLLRTNRPANLAGIPAISVPCGFTEAGLPIGLQLIGLPTREALLLSIAYAFERANPRSRRPPIAISP